MCNACFGADPEAVWAFRDRLTHVAELIEESHFSVRLRRCPLCAQHFAAVFCERIDFVGGNDPQDWLQIPLSEDETRGLIAAGERGAETCLRRLTPARRHLARYYAADADAPTVLFVDALIALPPHD